MTEPLLDIDDLQVRFDTGSRTVRAIDGLSLSVGSGEIVGLVGESGAGKSTVINLLSGLESPTSGTITIDGDPVGTVVDRSRAHLAAVGRLFQHPRSSLDPRQPARAAIEEPLREAGWNRKRRRQRIESLLSLVGLDERHAHRRPH
ncbi:oligopeptide/dipeptide ABC transporter, ATPase subunit [Natrinema sp. J7-2]|nr:oligopeptide/dipeptide ABC transporter, ATPase subunit [Natrinema sp. J7-2]